MLSDTITKTNEELIRICDVCGNTFKTQPCYIRYALTKGQQTPHYCGWICSGIGRSQALEARFWAKVDKSNDCWRWLGGLSRSGYGVTSIKHKSISAHRAAYQMSIGPVPAGMCVLHKCDNKWCVRPDHLFTGTHRENAADCKSKDRHARGERNGVAKLLDPQVQIIRSRYREGETQVRLAREYGIKQTTVSNIVRGESWKHLPL